MELVYLTDSLLVYFWFDIEGDLGFTESLVEPAEVFLWVSVYVKVYMTMKEMNLKYLF